MLPDLTLLLALLLGLASLGAGGPAPTYSPLGAAIVALVGGLVSWSSVGRARTRAAEGDAQAPLAAARNALLWPLLGWVAALEFFDWGAWVFAHVPAIAWMLRYVVLFLPALLAFSFGWVARAECEALAMRALGRGAEKPDPLRSLSAALRRNTLAFVPIGAAIGLGEALRVAGRLGLEPARRAALWMDHLPLLEWLAIVAALLVAIPFLPALVAWVVRARPLPPSELRDRVEQAARAVGLRYRDLYVWDTGGRALNAMVVGFTGRSRRILFTDRLLAELPPDELVAVFLHEAGHARRGHLPLYLALFLASSLWLQSTQTRWLEMGLPPILLLLGHLALIWFVLLGFVSRRFEREADLFAVDFGMRAGLPFPPATVNEVRPDPPRVGAYWLARVFERLRRATGGREPGHRHGTLEVRIAILEAYAAHPSIRDMERRAGKRWRQGIGIVAVLAVLPAIVGWPAAYASARDGVDWAEAARMEEAAIEAAEAGRTDGATTAWRAAERRYLDIVARVDEAPAKDERPVAPLAAIAAASVALDHLDDSRAARTHLEKAAAYAALAGTTPARPVGRQRLLFAAESTWARLWAREGNLGESERTFARAEAAYEAMRGGHELADDERRRLADVLDYTRGTLDAASPAGAAGAARHARARKTFARLAGSGSQEWVWRELRLLAQRALDRMGPAPAQEE